MDLDQGWGLTERQLRKMRLLEYIADGSRGGGVPRLPDWAPEGSEARDEAITHLKLFDSYGWLENFAIGGGNNAHARISGPGMAYLDTVRDRRGNARARREALPDAILAWLYDWEADHSERPQIQVFTASDFGKWFGEPFSFDAVSQATRDLAAEGLIDGPDAAEAGILEPKLTPDGSRFMRTGRSFLEPPPSGGGTYITQHGPQSIAQAGGAGSTLSAQITVTNAMHHEAFDIARQLRQLTSHLPEPDEAEAAAGELEQAATQRDVGLLRRAAVRGQGVLLTSMVGAAGADLYLQLHHLLAGLV